MYEIKIRIRCIIVVSAFVRAVQAVCNMSQFVFNGTQFLHCCLHYLFLCVIFLDNASHQTFPFSHPYTTELRFKLFACQPNEKIQRSASRKSLDIALDDGERSVVPFVYIHTNMCVCVCMWMCVISNIPFIYHCIII